MEEWIPWQTATEDKNIEIIVHSIENVIRKEDIHVVITVEHNGILLGESNVTLVKSTSVEEVAVSLIDLIVNLQIMQGDKERLNSIVSIPVLIKAMESVETAEEVESNPETKKKSVYATKSGVLPASKLLGICNLDLMPIVLGEETFTEKIVLETPTFSFNETSVSWPNLPRLTVTVSQDQTSLVYSDDAINFLSIAVESMYNLPESFTDNIQYKAGTIAFTDSEVPTNIVFDQGIYTNYRDVERTKRWNNLRHIENRAQLSKYKLDCDFMGVKNEFKNIDLAKMVCQDIARVEWNSLERCILWEEGIQTMRNHIRQYKYWPFQFEITGKFKGSSSSTTQLYQCYVDLSELLFPGRKSCRVVGQLYNYNSTEISEKVGLQENIFVLESQRRELKERDKKARNSKVTPSTQSEGEKSPSTALFTTNGEPTIIVIDVKLYKPLIACRNEEDYSDLITNLIPEKKNKSYVYDSDLAEAQYTSCIQKLAEVLTECYRNFCDENEGKNNKGQSQKKNCFEPESDELTCFTQYLYRNGTYLSICNTLRAKIPMLIDQKFEMPKNLIDSNESHDFISNVYIYLVEQMHLAVNKMVEGRFMNNLKTEVDLKTMHFYAQEAYELGDLDTAKLYYTRVIELNKNDPYAWTKYAVFLKRIGDTERAKECNLEAIKLDQKYPIALLVQAIILFENKEYRETEIFLRSITEFHPRFFEGWAILHLFYIRIEYYPGLDLTFRIAKKCTQDKAHAVTFDEESLSWTSIYCPTDNVYMMVATFLLKLNFCELAGLALAEEMSNSSRSNHLLYYMAVQHYLSGRYEDALSHLEEIRCNYGMDYSTSSLMGHCYFKLGNIEKQIECYEFARMLFDRPDDLHLVETRLGFHYYNTGDFDRAKRIFLSVCKFSPTSLTWLGVGISCYELRQFHEAEICLSEANRIDNHNPEIWAYLCLLSMTLERYNEFLQCYAEIIKNNLKNRKLWLRITDMMEALNYAPPNLTEIDDFVEDLSTEGSEEQFEN